MIIYISGARRIKNYFLTFPQKNLLIDCFRPLSDHAATDQTDERRDLSHGKSWFLISILKIKKQIRSHSMPLDWEPEKSVTNV